jgi:hypothetical protein
VSSVRRLGRDLPRLARTLALGAAITIAYVLAAPGAASPVRMAGTGQDITVQRRLPDELAARAAIRIVGQRSSAEGA